MDKIGSLKVGYQSALDKVNLLKTELFELYKQYSLFDKFQIEGNCQTPCQ